MASANQVYRRFFFGEKRYSVRSTTIPWNTRSKGDSRNLMERDQEGLLRAYSDPRLKDARACPFCGGKNLAIFPGLKDAMFRRKTMRVACATCNSLGPIGVSEEHAVVVWNDYPARNMNANGEANSPSPDADS